MQSENRTATAAETGARPGARNPALCCYFQVSGILKSSFFFSTR